MFILLEYAHHFLFPFLAFSRSPPYLKGRETKNKRIALEICFNLGWRRHRNSFQVACSLWNVLHFFHPAFPFPDTNPRSAVSRWVKWVAKWKLWYNLATERPKLSQGPIPMWNKDYADGVTDAANTQEYTQTWTETCVTRAGVRGRTSAICFVLRICICCFGAIINVMLNRTKLSRKSSYRKEPPT